MLLLAARIRRSSLVRGVLAASVAAVLLVTAAPAADACCPAPPSGQPVVNADQTVILVWDPTTKMEHFIRRASFSSDAKDFGFLIPTPSKPDLDESGDAAFATLAKLTAPEVIKRSAPSAGCSGCLPTKSERAAASAPPAVVVLEQKTVAGFDASVLEASSGAALLGWLKDHGYAFSPEVEAWAKPYVEQGWKITALQVAKGDPSAKRIAAASLRLSFKTERPLFPYREPDTTKAAASLGATDRLLRIYFVSDARYDGTLTEDDRWTGRSVWAGPVAAPERDALLSELRLPRGSAPPSLWLTEYEDRWPYRVAPADLTFAKSADQRTQKKPAVVQYTANERGPSNIALAGLVFAPALWRSVRRRRAKG